MKQWYVLYVFLYSYGLILITWWISNHMLNKVWDDITNPFSNFDGVTDDI